MSTNVRPVLPAGRLERHSLALGLALLVLAALLVGLAAVATRGFPLDARWPVSAVIPADGPPVRRGDEVRVGGERIGQVVGVEPGADGALVEMELEEGPVGAGAGARVRVRGLSGIAYVELDRGDLERPLPAGSTIARSRTSAALELVDVLDVFDPPARRRLRHVAPTLGAGVLGRGADMNATVADLPATLAGLTPILRAASPRRGALSGGLANAGRVARAVAPRGSRELEVILAAAAPTLETLAARSAEVDMALSLLPELQAETAATAPEAGALLADARAATRELTPALGELQAALPAAERLVRRARDLRSATRLARATEPLLAETRPLLAELGPSTGALEPLLRAAVALVEELSPYGADLRLAAQGLRAVTERRYPQGLASGRRALRTVPVFTCHRARDPYPEPGESRRQRRSCRG